MEYVCPDIEQLISCFTCDSQSLPPFQLCKASHVNCSPCAKYMPQCVCGNQFDDGSHVLLDWMVSALKLKCKYAAKNVVGPAEPPSDAEVRHNCPENRWYALHELGQHYRSECPRNVFPCPWWNCDHVARIETATEHYDAAHGPFEILTPTNSDRYYEVTFKIPLSTQSKFVKKIFNGYLQFTVKKLSNRRKIPLLKMKNLNPADSLQYTHDWQSDSVNKNIRITVSIIIEALGNS